MRPQIDRESEDEKLTALAIFTDGYAKFLEQNQSEVDDIENQQTAFREGKLELIGSMRTLINDFKHQVRKSGTVVSLRALFAKNYHLTSIWGLTDQSLIRGTQCWPEEKDFAQVSPS